jgi:hypothetical protein
MRRLVFALVVGVLMGCRDADYCDEVEGCDQCWNCATEIGGYCRAAWRGCVDDPNCGSLMACADDCWLTMSGRDALLCERTCRGTIGGWALELYDEYFACVEDACTLSCEW